MDVNIDDLLADVDDDLFTQLLAEDGFIAQSTGIPARKNNGPAALSFAQQRLWFLQKYDPGSAAYNLLRVFSLEGRLSCDVLERAFQLLIDRHEILRTRFFEIDGEAVQEPVSGLVFSIRNIDLSGLTTEHQQTELQQLVAEESRRPFDLSVAPLLRGTLIQLGNDNACLLLNLHHIVTDDWSTQILMRDFAACYQAALFGTEPKLAPLLLQYGDFSAWQRDWLQGNIRQQQLDYWRNYLGERPPCLEMPTDFVRPAEASGDGDRLSFDIPPSLSQRLQAVCQNEKITGFVVLMAAWQMLLSRYSGQNEFLVGVPNANRHRLETEDLIGCFINTQVFRASIFPEMTCRQWFNIIATDLANAQNHQDLPFELLVDALDVERDLSKPPLFQVMFNYQTAFTAEQGKQFELPGLKFTPQHTREHTAKFDLTLDVNQGIDGISCSIEFNTGLYLASTVQSIADHFTHCLESLLIDTNQPLSLLATLGAGELSAVTHSERHHKQFDMTRSWLTRFSEQVNRQPDKTVASCGDAQLSYRTLDQRSDRLAAGLQQLGIGDDQVVALLDQRGLDLMVAMVGVIKAGAAWLPLDPGQPAARWQQIVASADVALVVAGESCLAQANAALSVDVVGYSSLDVAAAPLVIADLPQQLAYVLFTSGSTGLPKGVMVTREGMLNNMLAKVAPLELSEYEVIAQTASQCFDISVWQMLTAPILGASIQIVPDDIVREPGALLREIEARQISLLEPVPSLLQAMLAEPGNEALASLRWVLPTGEALPPGTARQWFARYPDIPLMNAYGPAECADDVAFAPLYQAPEDSVLNMPIGYPTANVALYVVDDALNRVPLGVVGELAVAGIGVGRGYRQDPGRTAGVFVPSPFGASGSRLYLTGDLVKRLRDGGLEYIGRKDFQVKVRGYRIELGEIEAVLEQLPQVKQAVVSAAEISGSQHLVAYISGDEATSDNDIKQQLSERLPGYMVPSLIMKLAQLPLNSNGKVDRKMLPAPDFSTVQQEYQAPETETEQQLAQIWQDLLQVEKVGRTDNFFELGGHSLLATRLVSQIESKLDKQLALKAVFETPVLSAQANALLDSEENRLPPLVKAVRNEYMPLSFAQQRMWILEQLEGGESYLMPGALALQGQLDIKALALSFTDLVSRHEALRTTFVERDGEPFQRVSEALDFTLAFTDLMQSSAQQVELAALIEGCASEVFDLSQAPLFRARVVKLNETDHVLLYALHHIIGDEWSGQLLINELSEAYNSRLSGEVHNWPALKVQYVDYALWQRDWLQGEVLEQQLDYWRGQLGEQHPVLELPYDYARPAEQSFAGDSIDFELGTEISENLRLVCHRLGVTPYQFLLAGFQILLARYTGQTDILVGTPIANRAKTELEGIVGCFINTQVMKLDLDESDSGEVLIKKVKKYAIQAQQYQDVPFEMLVKTLCKQRDATITPLFQVMFNYLVEEQHTDQSSLHGLTSTTIECDSPFAKFELLMTIQQGSGYSGYSGNLVYCTGLFDKNTITAFITAYQTLLQSMLQKPSDNWRTFELVDNTQVAEIEGFESCSNDFSFTQDIYQIFAGIALEHPGKVALVDNGKKVTYQELLMRVDNYASHLHQLGVGPGHRVAVMAHRRCEFVLSILAILKLGACYVPIEPTNPSERSRFILNDAGISLLIAGSEPEFTSQASRCRCITFSFLDEVTKEPVPEVSVGGTSAAYVMYTSGSTGQPKGVEIPQQGIGRLALGGSLPVVHSSTVLCASSLAFDAATFEIYASLLTGATLVFYPDEHINFNQLNTLIEVNNIDVAWMTAGLFDRYVEDTPRIPSSLRHLLVGGDSISASAVKTARDKSQNLCLINGYGPTENTTFTTLSYDLINQLSGRSRLPIGKPVAGTRVFVLDELKQRVPIGMSGELYTSGVGLATGYLNSEDLTKEKFVSLPRFDIHSRLYRTGDKVRWLADGEIEFIGRADNQVKVRGYRIELDEIEQVLLSHPSVKECVVIVAAEQAADKYIVAYIVLKNVLDWPHQQEVIKDFLTNYLPAFMRPSVLCQLDALPLNNNGKVDKRKLPQAITQQEVHIAPIGDIECAIAKIWQDLLKVEKVGRTDNFFDLGGHSLTAVSLMAKISNELASDVPMKLLFQYPNLADLAKQLTGQLSQDSTLLALAPNPELPLLFVVHGGGGHVSHYRPLARQLSECYSVVGVQSRELTEQNYQACSLQQMIDDYTQQIVGYSQGRKIHLLGWSDGCFISLGIATKLRAIGARVETLILVDGDMVRASQAAFSAWRTCVQALPELGQLSSDKKETVKCLLKENYKEGVEYLLSLSGELDIGEDLQVLKEKANTLLDSDFLLSSYQLPKPDQPFVLFLAEQTYEANNEQLWQNYGGSGCDVQILPGDHHSILNQPAFISALKKTFMVKV